MSLTQCLVLAFGVFICMYCLIEISSGILDYENELGTVFIMLSSLVVFAACFRDGLTLHSILWCFNTFLLLHRSLKEYWIKEATKIFIKSIP